MAELLAAAGAFGTAAAGVDWVEHLRSEHLSVGTYSLSTGSSDDQTPHGEDEIYVVTAGAATFVAQSGTGPAVPGTVIFVPAGEVHRFIDVTDDFATVVVFAPPETLET